MTSSASATLPAIVEHIVIDAPPDRVFDALVEPEQLRQWWGSTEMYTTEWQVDLRVGGEYVCTALAGGEAMTVRGRFLEVDRPRRLRYTWNASWDPTGETTVQFDLTPQGSGTHVQVTHSGFAQGADRAGYDEGWGRIVHWLNTWFQRYN